MKKPGYKSTEWYVVIALVLPSILARFGVLEVGDQQVAQDAIAGAVGSIYAIVRLVYKVKKGGDS